MSTRKKSIVYRVRGLPPGCTNDRLSEALLPFLTKEERDSFRPKISMVPSCYYGDSTVTAFLDVETPPQFLSELTLEPLKDWQVEIELGDVDDINFDRHFHGFTQLYPTAAGESIIAEYASFHSVLIFPPDTCFLEKYMGLD